MKLTIVSIKEKSEHAIAWVEANTIDGNMVIQPGYSPTTLILAENKEFTYCLKTGKHEIVQLTKPAILQVERHNLVLLLNS